MGFGLTLPGDQQPQFVAVSNPGQQRVEVHPGDPVARMLIRPVPPSRPEDAGIDVLGLVAALRNHDAAGGFDPPVTATDPDSGEQRVVAVATLFEEWVDYCVGESAPTAMRTSTTQMSDADWDTWKLACRIAT